MTYEEMQQYQAEREVRLEQISKGSAQDDEHIKMCLNLVDNEPDDLVRIYAKLWLERNICALALRLIKK